MNEAYRLVKNFVEKRQYRIVEESETHIAIRYQLSLLHLWFGGEDGFMTAAVSGFDEVTSENVLQVLTRCNKVNRELKQVKIYTLKYTIVATSEFYYCDEHDFEPLLQRAMNSVIDARGAYFRLKMESLEK